VTSFGEWREEINAIATPLSLGSELPLIVANVAAPAWVVSPEKFMNDIRPQLLATIRAIEKRYRPLAQR
jgi:DNA-binding IclR family transcriptional regulator